jgi:hypothetical protein
MAAQALTGAAPYGVVAVPEEHAMNVAAHDTRSAGGRALVVPTDTGDSASLSARLLRGRAHSGSRSEGTRPKSRFAVHPRLNTIG